VSEAGAAGLLAGRVALVTGAAGGIGRAVAEAMARAGASVALADLAGAVDDAAREVAGATGARTLAVRLDVADADATRAAAERVARELGEADIVVANAGILALHPAVDTPLATWRRVLEVNLTGAFLTATTFARRLQARGAGGRIIFTSSLFGLRGGRENAAYSASKFGMIGLMQCMAAELAPDRILVNAVCPGQMDTAMLRDLFRERAALRGVTEEQARGALEARIPLGRLGAMDELAGTYVWLASDLSRYVTGQSIAVDGGWQVG
jgi:NAD(P)-dependent dehydrogenase (short-subunit alcohol dehydrogenase family)